jgi:hypothetical protein
LLLFFYPFLHDDAHKQIDVDFLKSLLEQIRYCSQTLIIGCTNAREYDCLTTNTELYLTG